MKMYLDQREESWFSFQSWRWPLRVGGWLAAWMVLGAGGPVQAQAPPVFSHIGFVQVNGIPFDGQGQFKFALGTGSGWPSTAWSHDGSSVAGSEPATSILTSVFNGRYSVPLGDTNVANMTSPIPPTVWNSTNLHLRVWFSDGVHGFEQLTPDQRLLSVPYAFRAATVSEGAVGAQQLAAGAVQSGNILDGTIVVDDLANGAVTSAKILDNTVHSVDILNGTILSVDIADESITSADVLDGSLTLSDFNLGSVDVRYVLKSGDTMTGKLTALGGIAVGTATLDANAVAQINLPSSVSVPHLRIKSPLSNAGFGIQFANSAETWFVGPNIGNWSDGRFNILADSSNRGLIVATNGNVGIGSVSAASPFATLTVDGSIGFPTVSTPAMYVYPSGTSNADKPVIMHSPAFPEYGLYYSDVGDRFVMKSSASDTTPSLVVDLDSDWVAIATDTPKPGYELSVNGQIVCEELLVEDSADWPDFVFQDDYRLQPLEEVEAHIKERRHLPGIPTASEIAKNGLPIGEMQKRMMEKIEELTLHLIDQNKRMASQDERIRQLEAELGRRTTTTTTAGLEGAR